MASGLCAVVTRSQVSKPAPVSNAPEPELPASKSDSAAQESAPVNDSAAQESAPVNDVSDFQQRCSAAYDKDPLFKDESHTSQYTNEHGLWWASGDSLIIISRKAKTTTSSSSSSSWSFNIYNLLFEGSAHLRGLLPPCRACAPRSQSC